MEEAIFLTRLADKVYVIHRGATLRASKTMQNRAFDNPRIEFLFNKSVEHLYGDDAVVGLGLRDNLDDSEITLDVQGCSSRSARIHARTSSTESSTSTPMALLHSTVAALDAERFLASLPAAVLAQAVAAPTRARN